MKTLTVTETFVMQNHFAFSPSSAPYTKDADISSAEVVSKHLLHNGCQLHYWVAGPIGAPLVVLTHAEGVNHHSFDAQMQALTRSYRVLTWDIRGHGQSISEHIFALDLAVDDLQAILVHEKITSALFVGASVGGLITQLFACRFPELVQGIALLSCTPLGVRNTTAGRFFGLVTSGLLRTLPYWFILAQIPGKLSTRPEVQSYTAEAMKKCGQENFVAAWQAYEDAVVVETVYCPTCPLLVALGAYDRPSWNARVAALWTQFNSDIQPLIVPGAGHTVAQDNPSFSTKMLEDFLRRCTPANRVLSM